MISKAILPSLSVSAHSLCLWMVACGLLSGSSRVATAQPGMHEEALSWDRNVGGIVNRYCIDCHSAGDPSGNINLEEDTNVRDIQDRRAKWQRVRAVLRSGEMPPQDASQPKQEQRKQILDFVAYALDNLDCASIDSPGPPVLRRLNRLEYDNAVEDLIGFRINIAKDFPADPVAFGFDNTGSNASLSATEVETFHAASKRILAKAAEVGRREPAVQTRVFGAAPNPEADPEEIRQLAEKTLTSFSERAFRSPVEAYYVKRLLRIFDRGISEGLSYQETLSHCLTAPLISPRFLFRIEADLVGKESAQPIGDFEFANRLSFFIWSRGPDRVLLELAEAGKLNSAHPDILREQVRRMLQHENAAALADSFFAQWLDLRRLESYSPDKTAFPEFNAKLRRSMHREVRQTLLAIIRDQLPASGIIDADEVFVDDRLSQLYGLDPNTGQRKESLDGLLAVPAAGSGRGGLLATAGFLMLQADPDRTNIPRRGNFIMGQLLGIAPPPPPADVPALEVGESDEKLTLREIFEKHRSAAECKGCHAKIDPIGFSLENFDAMGRHRELDRGEPIDSNGELPDGRRLNGIHGLKQYLLSEEDKLLRTLSQKLLVYATGRGLVASDECTVKAMMQSAKENDLRFSAIVTTLCESLPMTHRRTAQE